MRNGGKLEELAIWGNVVKEQQAGWFWAGVYERHVAVMVVKKKEINCFS